MSLAIKKACRMRQIRCSSAPNCVIHRAPVVSGMAASVSSSIDIVVGKPSRTPLMCSLSSCRTSSESLLKSICMQRLKSSHIASRIFLLIHLPQPSSSWPTQVHLHAVFACITPRTALSEQHIGVRDARSLLVQGRLELLPLWREACG